MSFTEIQAQQQAISEAESKLGVGPVELARLMGTPYPTFKDWKSGRRGMTPVAMRCLELVQIVRAAGLI